MASCGYFADVQGLTRNDASVDYLCDRFRRVTFAYLCAFNSNYRDFICFYLVTTFFRALRVFGLFRACDYVICFGSVSEVLFFRAVFIDTSGYLNAKISANLDAYHDFFGARFKCSNFSDFHRATRTFGFLGVFPDLIDRFIDWEFCVMEAAP